MLAGQRPNHSTVRNGNDRFADIGRFPTQTTDCGVDPFTQRRLAFATGNHRQGTVSPRVELTGPRRLNLGRCLAGPLTDVAFPQARDHLTHGAPDGGTEYLRSATRSQQVRRDEANRGAVQQLRQRDRGVLGLSYADFVEIDICPPLPAVGCVPQRLAMAHGKDTDPNSFHLPVLARCQLV